MDVIKPKKEKGVKTVKYSLDYIKEKIANEGYILLSEVYINSWTKMKIACPNGHTYESTWNNFQSGKRCMACSRVIVPEKKRVPVSEIIDYIHREGYEIVSGLSEYKTFQSELVIRCPKGHTYETKYKYFNEGTRCQECQGRIEKLTYDYVNNYVTLQNYKLIKFTNYNVKMTIKCPYGHEYLVKWPNFQQGQRCVVCSGRGSKDHEQVKLIFEENGCELLTKTYVGTLQKLKFICSCGKRAEKTFKHFQRSGKCKNCGMKEKGRIEFHMVKTIFDDAGCELLIDEREYKKSTAKMKYRCSCKREMYNVQENTFY